MEAAPAQTLVNPDTEEVRSGEPRSQGRYDQATLQIHMARSILSIDDTLFLMMIS